MVFENLTLFELHLENSRFARGFGEDVDDVDEETAVDDQASDGSSGRGLGRIVGALVLLGIVAMAVRRFRSGEPETEAEEDSDQITIEHAAEQ